MRLGIFGGTFDPVHYGHLLVAEQCLEQCGLDQVRFVPAGVPPHKLARAIAPARARAEMLDLAVANRGGAPRPDLAPLRAVLGESLESRIQFVTIPGVDISSSDIRLRVGEGRSIRYMTPRAVECYIETCKLYSQK